MDPGFLVSDCGSYLKRHKPVVSSAPSDWILHRYSPAEAFAPVWKQPFHSIECVPCGSSESIRVQTDLPERSKISTVVLPASDNWKDIAAEETNGFGLADRLNTREDARLIPVPVTVKLIVSAVTAVPP